MEIYKCPNCGGLFNKENLPSKCPNCGKSFPNRKKRIWIFIIGIVIVGSIFVIQRNKSAQALALQEQQERERVECVQQEEQARQREEREQVQRQKQLQKQKEQMMNVVVGTWRSETIHTRSRYCSMSLYFYSSGKFECKLYDSFTGYCLDRQSGTFSVVPKSSGSSAGIVLNPNSSNSSWIDYEEGSFSDHLYFGDYSFTKSSSY